MRPRGILMCAAALSLALVPAGCGKKQNYKGGEVPQAAEGGTREPGTEIDSLNELRGVVVRVNRDGFEPRDVVINLADTVAWKNIDDVEHQIVKLSGPGGRFASRTLSPGQVYQRSFQKNGKFVVKVDTDPPAKMVVTVPKR